MYKEKEVKYKWWPREYLSISSMQSFWDCPVSFYLHYFQNIKSPDSESMELGKKFQDILNIKYSGGDVKEAVREIPKEHRTMARKLLKQANEFEDIISIDAPMMTDIGVGIPITFVPDLLTKHAIVENKYTGGYYNRRMVNQQKQATLYYLGVVKELGFKPKILYQIFNRTNGTVELIEVKKEQKDIDELVLWIDRTLKGIEKCYKSGIWFSNEHTRFDCMLEKGCPLKV